jgi:hypothetical protein
MRISFESKNYPGRFICDRNYQLWIDPNDGSDLFKLHATFQQQSGLADGAMVSFESVNFTGNFIRHKNYQLWIEPNDGSDLFRQDATFRQQSGLADGTLVSFESVNNPGYFIRHKNYQLWIDPNDGSELFKQDATFRQLPGIATNIRPHDTTIAKLRMADAQLLLRKASVNDLSQTGTLLISKNLALRPGILQPRNVAKHGNPTTQELNYLGTLASNVYYAPPESIPSGNILQKEAVLIGSKVDLANSRLIISENVIQLTIIAEEIIAGPQAEITWYGVNVVPPRPQSYNDPQLQHGPNFKSYNPTDEVGGISAFHSPTGEGGGQGAPGNPGNNGLSAPNVKIVTGAFNGVPTINLRGGPGGLGEDGQMGGDGGHGAKGLHAASGLFDCQRGAGWGGNGGNGGDGGKGGEGGHGGSGGTIDLCLTIGAIESWFQHHSDITAGSLGGPAGKGGAGGNPGRGGDPGRGDHWCSDEPGRRGNDGKPGAAGADGEPNRSDPTLEENYGPNGQTVGDTITRDELLRALEDPHLRRLDPAKDQPGKSINAYGLNLIEGDLVIFDNMALQDSRFLVEDVMVFTVPVNAMGGFHTVKIKQGDDYTESINFEVTPLIESISPTTAEPGQQVTIIGKAFMPDARVVFGDRSLVPISATQTRITFQIPITGSASSWNRDDGGLKKVAVYNPYPSDEMSNQVDMWVQKVYGLRFDPTVDGWNFSNNDATGKGVPSMETLCRIFGEEEVWAASIFEPVTFIPFATWYIGNPPLWAGFGSGPNGICTGMATTSLERFRGGSHHTHQITLQQAIREITIAFGHMLGIDQLRRFNDQVKKGTTSVSETLDAIETFFKNGSDLRQAPVLMFLPSGTIWDMDRFGRSHTVVPYKITYENNQSRLPAKVYIYDNNHPDNRDLFVRFFEKNGTVNFEYRVGQQLEYDVDHGYTLGNSSLDFMLLSDPDMPISLITGGILLLDTIFSPVRVRIENEKGKIIGYKDGKVHLEIPDGLFIPFAPNCYVLPFGDKYTRTIEGMGDGSYSYGITSSEGFSLMMKGIPTKAGSVDILAMTADAQAFTFQSQAEAKSLSVVLCNKVGKERRVIEIEGLQVEKGEKALFWLEKDLNSFGVSNNSKPRSINVKFHYQKGKDDQQGTHFNMPNIVLKAGDHLTCSIKDWSSLSASTAQQSLSSDKNTIPQKVRDEFPD